MICRFQEIVPLTAGNVVLGFGNRRVSKKWNSLIRTALNKTPAKIQEADIGAPQKVHPLKDQAVGFCCIISKQMVGLYISVWIRHYLCPYVRHSSVSSVRCGIMGCLGNKVTVDWFRNCVMLDYFSSPNKVSLLKIRCGKRLGNKIGRKSNVDM